jgi:hypothetical protein
MNKDIKVAKQDWWGVIVLICYSIFIGLVITLFVLVRYEGTKCVADPFNYGSKQLAKEYKTDIIGTINILKKGYSTIYFSNEPNISRGYVSNLSESNIELFSDSNISLR